MTQQVVHGKVTLPSVTPFCDDVHVDFVFEVTGSDTTIDWSDPDNPESVIEAFFNTVPTGGAAAVGNYLSEDVSRATGAAHTDWYDVTGHLNGSAAGPPIRGYNWTLVGASGHNCVPPGVAATLGYRRDYGTDVEHSAGTRPRSRDRGRIFVGPLNFSAILPGFGSSTYAIHGLLSLPFQTDLMLAGNLMAETHNAGSHNQFNWVQWSRKNASVDPIRWLFVDEACTYQRRRADDTANRVHDWQPVT